MVKIIPTAGQLALCLLPETQIANHQITYGILDWVVNNNISRIESRSWKVFWRQIPCPPNPLFLIFLMFCSDHVRDDESNHFSTVGSSKSTSSSFFLGKTRSAMQDRMNFGVMLQSRQVDPLINRILWCIPVTFRRLLKLLFQKSPIPCGPTGNYLPCTVIDF